MSWPTFCPGRTKGIQQNGHLFATHLNHNLPLYVSHVPDPNAWDIDALNINWTALTAYIYPPTALLHRVIQNQAMLLPDHRNSPRLARDALVLGPSAALNRDPTATPGVNNFSQTVPQSSQPPCLVSRSARLQEQGFSVKVAERIAAPQRSSTRTIYKSKWTLFQKWSRENSVDFSTPSVKQISDFFMYLYQDLNRRPPTIVGYRTAIVDTFGPAGTILHKVQTFTGYSPVFTGIFQNGTFLLFSMSSQKHPLSL